MCAATRKHLAKGILSDLLVALVAILTVYIYLYYVLLPKVVAAHPRPEGLWEQAEVHVSFILLLVWIALETGAFFLFLRSHFARILAAVTLANAALFFLKLSNKQMFAVLFGSPEQLAETDPQALLNAVFLWPLLMLALMVAAKGVLYATALRRLPTKRVLLSALYANLVALAVWFGLLLLFVITTG
jgi:hypothetical protein